MCKQVQWTLKLKQDFIHYADLNEDEAYIIMNRGKLSIQQLSFDLCKSTRTIDDMISSLKRKYDLCRRDYPDIFPQRRMRKNRDNPA